MHPGTSRLPGSPALVAQVKRVACDGQVMGPRLGYLQTVAMQARAFFQVRYCRVWLDGAACCSGVVPGI